MKTRFQTVARGVFVVLAAAALAWVSGCESSGSGGAVNTDPGSNDVNVYVVVGDSVPQGNGEPFPSWPARLGPMIGKTVINQAIDGDTAGAGAGRVAGILSQFKPGYLVIQYGVTDIISGHSAATAAAGVESIVNQAKANQTLPVVCTYPKMIGPHLFFQGEGMALNNELRSMAARQGIPLIDMEAEFGSDESLYMEDGLHPNDIGTERMAQAAADVLK